MPADVSNFHIMGVESTYDADSPCCFRCDLVERLTANTALVIGGTVAATLTASDSEISGLLFGAFFVADKATHPLTQFPIEGTGIDDFVCGANEGTWTGADAHRRVQRIVGLSFRVPVACLIAAAGLLLVSCDKASTRNSPPAPRPPNFDGSHRLRERLRWH